MGTPEDVASFLGQIGRNNADYIRHICIHFPKFLYLDPGDVTLEDDSLGILRKYSERLRQLEHAYDVPI